ncbi:MAG: acyloxyacyl hydrolase [Desulfobacterales bacterium]|nr:acyloxyacyl hydrolase [Desulfobacterales bacterium]
MVQPVFWCEHLWFPYEEATEMTIINHTCETRTVSCVGFVVRLLLLSFIWSLLVPAPSYSEEMRLLNLSFRARISGATILGEQQPEEFEEYDLAANFGLPWLRYPSSGWGVSTRLMASVGIMRGAGENGLVVSLIPGVALGSEDGRFFFDVGAGGALLSRYRFGTQDYGGPFQFALTVGAGFPLYKRLGLGYRFLHYSDAGVNGPDTIGADFHMIEFSYWF